jgi:hypothetical protein
VERGMPRDEAGSPPDCGGSRQIGTHKRRVTNTRNEWTSGKPCTDLLQFGRRKFAGKPLNGIDRTREKR